MVDFLVAGCDAEPLERERVPLTLLDDAYSASERLKLAIVSL